MTIQWSAEMKKLFKKRERIQPRIEEPIFIDPRLLRLYTVGKKGNVIYITH